MVDACMKLATKGRTHSACLQEGPQGDSCAPLAPGRKGTHLPENVPHQLALGKRGVCIRPPGVGHRPQTGSQRKVPRRLAGRKWLLVGHDCQHGGKRAALGIRCPGLLRC